MNKKTIRWSGVLFVFVTLFALMMFFYYFDHSKDQKDFINSSKIEELKIINKVNLKSSSGIKENIPLPAFVDSSQSYSFTFIVPRLQSGDSTYIQFNSFYFSYLLRCGEDVITSNFNEQRRIVKSGGKSFNLIQIPDKYVEKPLELEFKSNLHMQKEMTIPPIVIGAKGKILKEAINQGINSIVLALALFITGFFLFVIDLFLNKSKSADKNVLIMALFSIIIAFYIYSRSWIVFYYLDNTLFLYFIENICLIVLPIPLLLLFVFSFYSNGYDNWRVKVFENLTYFVFLNFVVQLVLTLTGISEFKEMQRFSLYVLIVLFLFIIVSTATIKKELYKDKYYMLISIIPLFIVMSMVYYAYFKTHVVLYFSYTILAVLFFLFVHSYVAVVNYVHILNSSIEKDFYEELAYFDILTSVKNRHAFKRMMEKLKNIELDYTSIHLIVLDMNDLKVINDQCGHHTGDEFLKKTGEILGKVEKEHKRVESYRYGGDEFVLICLDYRDDEVEIIIDEIKTQAKEYVNPHTEKSLSLAVGYASIEKKYFENQELNLDIIFERADRKMYGDKAKYKEKKVYEK